MKINLLHDQNSSRQQTTITNIHLFCSKCPSLETFDI